MPQQSNAIEAKLSDNVQELRPASDLAPTTRAKPTLAKPVAFQVRLRRALMSSANTTVIYAGAEVAGAAHPQAARAWLEFIRSPEALAIFERYGFKPYDAAKP
jgi:ABC-type molybdate transport system substrate-binding protein